MTKANCRLHKLGVGVNRTMQFQPFRHVLTGGCYIPLFNSMCGACHMQVRSRPAARAVLDSQRAVPGAHVVQGGR